MNFNELIKSKEYDFLRTNPKLKDRIILLVVGGSYSYGTNSKNSDIDIRGIYLETKDVSLGFNDELQYNDTNTDTVMYSLKKFLNLVRECNPNIIEMLYAKEEHYLYLSDLGKVLLQNRDLFLTKRAAYSFSGYANVQLNRLENALARDTLTEFDKMRHINNSIENMINSFETKYKLSQNDIKTYIDNDIEGNPQIYIDFKLNHFPVKKLKSINEEVNQVLQSYNKTISHRNNKKDDYHLNKHMMHLVRLYYMGIEILKNKTAHTYMEEHIPLLLDIKNGKYRDEKGYMKASFTLLVNNLKEELDSLKTTSLLPNNVDKDKFNKLILNLYKEAFKYD